MGYLLVAVVSFFIGYALCFGWFKRDIIEGKPIVFKDGVYVAYRKKIEPWQIMYKLKKDLQFYCDELSKYQNLSHSGLSRGEMMTIDGIMIRLKEQIKNLRTVLHAWC